MTGRRRHKIPAGCWTCLLRRKRCDSTKPRCTPCAELEIQCHVSAARPAWMDGGSKQKEMADRIKAQIKRTTTGRRERRLARQGQQSTSTAFIVTSKDDFTGRAGDPESSASTEPEQLGSSKSSGESANTRHDESNGVASLGLATFDPLAAKSEDKIATTPLVQFASLGAAWEQDFVMIYLDYVFPFLFPYYRPPVVSTSRSWLLSFIEQNKIIRHSVLSMSSFFFTIGITDTCDANYAPCSWTVWREVTKHADKAFAMIQHDMLTRGDTRKLGLVDKVHVMVTITQLLVFDMLVGSTAGWMMHLKPALSLLIEVLQDYNAGDASEPGLSGVLQSPEWEASISECTVPLGHRRLWTPEQSSLRFFTALLITVDIIASTAISKAPSLQPFHSTILADVAPEKIAVGLDLYSFAGCHNWALAAVGQIAALDAWKKETKTTGKGYQVKLEQWGDRISQDLAHGLKKLETGHTTLRSSQELSRLQMFYTGLQPGEEGSDTCTKLWAYSARIYLNTVLHGWNPYLQSTQEDATRIRDLLRTVSSVAKLRTFAWPACVAGCMTQDRTEREALTGFLRDVGHKLLLRSVYQAIDIMEAVWQKGDSLSSETWDLAACLGVLGTPALLF